MPATVRGLRAGWRRARPTDAGLRLRAGRAEERNRQPRLLWRRARRSDAAVKLTSAAPTVRDQRRRLHWLPLRALAGRMALLWRRVQSHDAARLLPWASGAPASGGLALPWQTAPAAQQARSLPWALPMPGASAKRLPWRPAAPLTAAHRLPWGPAGRRERGLSVVYPDYPGPVETWPVVRPLPRGSYCVINTVNAHRLPDGLPLRLVAVDIALDVDAWAWRLSASIIGKAAMDAIRPGRTNRPRLEVVINGYAWQFLVVGWRRDRRFGDDRYSITATGPQQQLAAPFAPARSRFFETEITAKQAAQAELENTDYTLDWPTESAGSTPDWIIPGGVYGYTGTAPLDAIARIARTAGSVLIPSRDGSTLSVQPRYKYSPWDLGSIEPDVSIPAALAASEGSEYHEGVLCGSVFVSGTTAGAGVVVELSTGAGIAAPDVIEDDLLDETVCRERGRIVLSESGSYHIEQITLPLLPAPALPGLLLPGQVAEFFGDPAGSLPWRGYVLGVGINAPGSGSPVITQSASVLRHNDYRA